MVELLSPEEKPKAFGVNPAGSVEVRPGVISVAPTPIERVQATYNVWQRKAFDSTRQLNFLQKQYDQLSQPILPMSQMTPEQRKQVKFGIGQQRGTSKTLQKGQAGEFLADGKRFSTSPIAFQGYGGFQPPPEQLESQRLMTQMKVQLEATTNEMTKAQFFAITLNMALDPDIIGSNPNITAQELLALSGARPSSLTTADMEELSSLTQTQLDAIMGKLQADETIETTLPKLVKPLPQPKMVGLVGMTRDLLVASLKAPKTPDQVMTDAEWQTHLEASVAVDPNMLSRAEQKVKEWQDLNSQLEANRQGLAKLPTYKFWDYVKQSVMGPGVIMGEAFGFYAEHVSQPLAGALWKTMIPDINSAYIKYKKEGSSYRDALVQAWQGWIPPGAEGGSAAWAPDWILKYVLMEGLTDPLTYFGWGIATKVTKPLGTFGRFIGASEKGLMEVMDVPFDTFKVLWNKLPKSIPQQALLVRARTGQYYKAGLEIWLDDQALKGLRPVTLFRNVVEKDLTDFSSYAIGHFIAHPASEDAIAMAGRDLLMHKPFTLEQVKGLAGKMNSSMGDLSARNVMDVNEVFEDFLISGNIKLSQTSDRLVQALHGTGNKSHEVASTWLREQAKKIVQEGKTFATKGKPIDNMIRLMERNYAFAKDTLEATASVERLKLGRIASLFNDSTSNLARVWSNSVDRFITRPLASAYLTFGMYGPMNTFEDIVRSGLGGVKPGMLSQREFEAFTQGLGVDPILMIQRSMSESGGDLFGAMRLASKTGRNNWVLTLAEAPLSVPTYGVSSLLKHPITPSEFARGTQFVFQEFWNRMGADLRRNFLIGRYKQILLSEASDEVKSIVKVISRFDGTPDKVLNRQVSNYVAGLALTGNPELLRSATSTFTMKTIQENALRKVITKYQDIAPEIRNVILERFRAGELFDDVPRIILPADFVEEVAGVKVSSLRVAEKIAKRQRLNIEETQFYNNNVAKVEETLQAMAGPQFPVADSIEQVFKDIKPLLRNDLMQSPELASQQIRDLVDLYSEMGVNNAEEMAQAMHNVQIISDTYDMVPKDVLRRASIYSRGLPFELRNAEISQAIESVTRFNTEAGDDLNRLVKGISDDLNDVAPAIPDYDIGLGEHIATPAEIKEAQINLGTKATEGRVIDQGYIDKVRELLTEAAENVKIGKTVNAGWLPSEVQNSPNILQAFKESGWTSSQVKSWNSEELVRHLEDLHLNVAALDLLDRYHATGYDTLKSVMEDWFHNSDNNALQILGRRSSQSPEYLSKVRGILYEKYPSGYIRIYRGGGKAGKQYLDRDYTNVTSSRTTAAEFENTWTTLSKEAEDISQQKYAFLEKYIDKERPSNYNDLINEFDQKISEAQYRNSSPLLDNVLIKVDDIVSIGSVDESELIIPTKILRERIESPLPAPVKEVYTPEYKQAVNDLLNLRVAKSTESARLRNDFNAWRQSYFEGVSKEQLKDSMFWNQFYSQVDGWISKIEANNIKYDTMIDASKVAVDGASGIVKAPRANIVVMGALAPADIAQMLDVRMNDLTSNLLNQTVIQHDKDRFVAYVMAKVQPGDVGFTPQSVGRAYDQIVSGIAGNGKTIDMLTAKEMQLDAMKVDVHSLYNAHQIKPDDVKSIHDYFNTQANNLKGVTIDRAQYNATRQKAMDEAHKWYYKEFTDYTHGNVIDDFMKYIYPFWTYESNRWQWLPRAVIRHPILFTQLGRFANETDGGYLHLPGTSVEINPFRGTVFGPLMRTQVQNYSSYYDSIPGGNIVQVNDVLGRWGFYPGAPWSLILSAFGGQESQLGETVPAMGKSVLDVAVGMFPDNPAINFISDRIFSDRFRNYLTLKEVIRRGGDGAEIGRKLRLGEKITPEEEVLFNGSRSAVSWYSAGFEQFGLFRLRSEEQIAIKQACEQAIYDMTGFTPDQQKEMQDKGLKIWDYVGGMSPSQQAVLEAMGYWKYAGMSAELMGGEQQAIVDTISQGWDDVSKYNENSVTPAIKLLESRFLQGQIGPDDYSAGLKEIYSNKSTYIDGKTRDNPLMLLENRAEYYKKYGIAQPVMHPFDELLAMYFNINLEEEVNPETGAIEDNWQRFYSERAAVEQALPDDLKQEWNDYLAKNQSPLEEVRRKVYDQYFTKYYDVFDSVLARYSAQEQKDIKEYMSLQSTNTSKERRDILDTNGMVSKFRGEVSEAKEALRFANPYLDAWLNFWGKTTSFQTPASQQAYYQIVKDMGRKL